MKQLKREKKPINCVHRQKEIEEKAPVSYSPPPCLCELPGKWKTLRDRGSQQTCRKRLMRAREVCVSGPHPDRFSLMLLTAPKGKTSAQTCSSSLPQTPTTLLVVGWTTSQDIHLHHGKLFWTCDTFAATTGILDNEMALTCVFSQHW